MRWEEMKREERSSGDTRRDESSFGQLRRAEQGREDVRWDEVRCIGTRRRMAREHIEAFARDVSRKIL